MGFKDLLKKVTCIFITYLLFTTSSLGLYSSEIDNEIDKNKHLLKNDFYFNHIISILLAIGHMPSISTGIIKDEKLVWVEAYGKYDIRKNLKADTDTIYAVASISKPVTATALQALLPPRIRTRARVALSNP